MPRKCNEDGCKVRPHYNNKGETNALYCNTHKLNGMVNILTRYCEHNKRKSACKECGGSGICEHDKRKSKCKECGGREICEHNREKIRCKECGGSQICEHERIKSNCRECGGSQICEHNNFKCYCKICSGSQICIHNKHKSSCKECGGGSICEHKRIRSQCKECGGGSICEHTRIRSQCKECGGGSICEHNKLKTLCKTCSGSALCKSSWCETTKNPKYEGYCLNCFIHQFPDKSNARNYKTKEKTTADYVLERFPDFTWVTDKRIQYGCSKKRPDLLLDLGYQVIIVEIDENQHDSYDCSCENKRLMLLSQDVGHRPMVFIRFNPDDYLKGTEKITSCWSNNKLGVCTIKRGKVKEWNERLEILNEQIAYWSQPDNKTEKTIEIVQLFYDCD